MDAKKLTPFLAGAVFGCAATLCIVWLVQEPRSVGQDGLQETFGDARHTESTTNTQSAADPAPEGNRSAAGEQSDERRRESVPRETIPASSNDQHPRVDSSRLVPQTPPPAEASRTIPISDAHQKLLGDSGGRYSMHARIEAEPEDDSWAYFMEQSIRLFISQHEHADKFSLFNVECRTTLCEIQVIGYDESTGPDWQRILYDLGREPWYDFGQVGTSSADYQGQLALVTHLTRLPD